MHAVPRLRRWLTLVVATVLVAGATGFSAVWTNALGAGDRFDRLLARIEAVIDPPPNRPTVPTVVVTPRPSPIAAIPSGTDSRASVRAGSPTPTPTPVRGPVDVAIVRDHAAVFASQLTNKMCAVAATQMVLTILGLGDTSDTFQNELDGRIGEWESWEDSHNGGWGPGAIAKALAAYGASDYEIRAYVSRDDALRDSAIAISQTGKPAVLLPWWGAHTWVMTGYRADADPTVFADARISGAYILDPWYPRVSSIWGPSDPPGNFEDTAELERNFIPWSRPEGAYPDRDGTFVVVLPTEPLASHRSGAVDVVSGE